ncbi:MAG: ABC-type transport auxiliary lipoprotein family protein [Sphingobium sp.]|uniref:ABC-type transport auxiliary lipoprotein family protein n=1 Tax=Sphingobium sp. TaxID=1912891 RepID=UPI0029B846C1|nr:ABC-type transport auxiliary lipoprotein family protein [Sphingobium sp.]MDX3910710.1 ABC-type transport auxiliary lipoprotein family protein [Sphingobium sp.]
MILRPLAALAFLLTLSACVGALLGGGKPDDLYRLDVTSLAIDPPTGQPHAARRPIVLLRTRFAPEVDGDRLLTTQGHRAMYIKDARWVTSASDLFTQSLRDVFAARAPDILLATPRQPAGADYALQLNIERFEAVYAPDGAKDAAPTVRIEGEVRLIRIRDGKAAATQAIATLSPAAQNRTGAIVPAFGAAASEYMVKVVDWSASLAVQSAGFERR